MTHSTHLDGLVHIPLVLGERALAVHHARARLVAQVLHRRGRDVCAREREQEMAQHEGNRGQRNEMRSQPYKADDSHKQALVRVVGI